MRLHLELGVTCLVSFGQSAGNQPKRNRIPQRFFMVATFGLSVVSCVKREMDHHDGLFWSPASLSKNRDIYDKNVKVK